MGPAPRLVERLLLLGQSMASISSQSRETVRAGIPSCSQETDEPRPGWRSNTCSPSSRPGHFPRLRTTIKAGFAVLVPAGAKHNIINTGSVPLKLYTLYAPPNHRDGVVHHTRKDAEGDTEHFNSKTTE